MAEGRAHHASAKKRNVVMFKEDATPDNAKNTTSTVIPAMRYRDAPAAIDWLGRAFGFEKHLVVRVRTGVSRMPNSPLVMA